MTQTTDFLVIGGGIIGLSIAHTLKHKYPDCRVDVLEKEDHYGEHASGRNSGVLHAGFYYSADSLKARFCKLGNEALHAYCREKNIPLNTCGKLVVARDESELQTLQELKNRADRNGVELEKITDRDAAAIEPQARTYQWALWSPTTSAVDPMLVLAALTADLENLGVNIHYGDGYLRRRHNRLDSERGSWQCGYIVNAAGLYADRIARDFGFSKDYYIMPFKGLYLYADRLRHPIRTHIYPVPDLRFPFLGVHVTVNAAGQVKLGPTAVPAFWREHYSGFSRFKLREFLAITARQSVMFTLNRFGFRRLALHEIQKYAKSRMHRLAGPLLKDPSVIEHLRWGKPGVRAQLFNKKTKSLEMDFILESDRHCMHVLNAVSPAFTCCFPFADHVVANIEPR